MILLKNYTDLFTIVLRNDDIQEFDSKWDGILLSMTKIPHDDVLEGLYKLRIRESAKLNTVLELYDLEIKLKELAITHSVKNGTLQNACSTRPRVVVGLEKSARSQIVRLMNSRRKGLKKVLWLY